MEKRDIQIDYSLLEDLCGALSRYRNTLYHTMNVLTDTDRELNRTNEAKFMLSLERLHQKAQKAVERNLAEADAIYDLVDAYITDMNGITQSTGGMTRVSRNDIYGNMQSIRLHINSVHQLLCIPIPSELGFSLSEEERQKGENNYNKLMKLQRDTFLPLEDSLKDSYKKLSSLYKDKIREYEQTDDAYREKGFRLRCKYTNPCYTCIQAVIDAELLRDTILQGIDDTYNGFIQSMKELPYMTVVGAGAVVATPFLLFSDEPPAWATFAMEESEVTLGGLANLILHPMESAEQIATKANAISEEKGPAYLSSCAVTGLAILIISGKVLKVRTSYSQLPDEVTALTKNAALLEDSSVLEEITFTAEGTTISAPATISSTAPLSAEKILEYSRVTQKAATAVNASEDLSLLDAAGKVRKPIRSGRTTIKSSDLVFGSSTKSTQKLINQMNSRGWTEDLIRNTVDNPYTIRTSVNKATGNAATVFYTQQGSYVIVDDVTKAIVQISDNINPSTWAPDLSIVNPYIPD